MTKKIILGYIQLFIPCAICGEGSCKRTVCHCGSVHCDRLGINKCIEFTSKSTRHHYVKPRKTKLKCHKCHFCKASTAKGDYDRCYGYHEINRKSKNSYLVTTSGDHYYDCTYIPICCKHTHNELKKLLLTNLLYGFCYVAIPKTYYQKHLCIKYDDQVYALASNFFTQCSFCKFFYGRQNDLHTQYSIKFKFGREMKGKCMCVKCYDKYKVDRGNVLFTELNAFDTGIESLLNDKSVKKIAKYSASTADKLSKDITKMEAQLKKMKAKRSVLQNLSGTRPKIAYKLYCQDTGEVFDNFTLTNFVKSIPARKYIEQIKVKKGLTDYPFKL